MGSGCAVKEITNSHRTIFPHSAFTPKMNHFCSPVPLELTSNNPQMKKISSNFSIKIVCNGGYWGNKKDVNVLL